MKTSTISLILLMISLIFSAIDAVSKFDVHVLYFKPRDASEIDRIAHDTMLKDIQKYLQSEMTRHGFVGKTFPLELDGAGNLVIHTVLGKHNTARYDVDDQFKMFENLIEPELPARFNNEINWDSRDNVHLVIVGGIQLNGDWNRGPAFGFMWRGGRWGGNAVVAMDNIEDFPNHYLGTLAHELGHAFGLDPGHNDVAESFNGTVIAWGRTTAEWGDRMRLLKHEAALIDSRPIFRKIDLVEVPQVNKNPDLELGDDTADADKGEPISVRPHRKITVLWGALKSR